MLQICGKITSLLIDGGVRRTLSNLELNNEAIGLNPCNFCEIPEKRTTDYFKGIYGDLPHTLDVPDIPEGFTVLQDLVPIAETGGHLLLMPDAHNISMAVVDDKDELEAAKSEIIQALQEIFPDNPIFTFEHGPGFIEDEPIACGGCHMDHAHEHFLLMPEDFSFSSLKKRIEQGLKLNGWEEGESFSIPNSGNYEEVAEIVGYNPYLQIGSVVSPNETDASVYLQNRKDFNVPSQMVRATIAEVVYERPDSTFWHWRDIESGLTDADRLNQLRSDAEKFRAMTGF